MIGRHRRNRDFRTLVKELEARLRKDPEAWAAYERERAELMTSWDVVCRHGCCVWWVAQDSDKREDLGGYGPAGCQCACNSD